MADDPNRLAVCTGKEPMTWAIAITALRRSKDIKRGMYHCRFCRAWHLGRKPKSARKPRVAPEAHHATNC